jgi:putative hydrolase of the HAD superfamily
MIKAIIFDYFGVVSSDEYWAFVGKDRQGDSTFSDLADQVNTGQLGWERFKHALAKVSGKSVEAVERMYQSERINPELIAYVAELRQSSKTALLTNAHHDFIDPIVQAGHLQEVFDAIIVSSRVGTVKPDPRIYRYALQQLGVEPGEAVFIDDIQRNVDGAVAVGMAGILYQNLPLLQQELSTLLE